MILKKNSKFNSKKKNWQYSIQLKTILLSALSLDKDVLHILQDSIKYNLWLITKDKNKKTLENIYIYIL